MQVNERVTNFEYAEELHTYFDINTNDASEVELEFERYTSVKTQTSIIWKGQCDIIVQWFISLPFKENALLSFSLPPKLKLEQCCHLLISV